MAREIPSGVSDKVEEIVRIMEYIHNKLLEKHGSIEITYADSVKLFIYLADHLGLE